MSAHAFDRKICFERPAIDGDLAIANGEPDTRHSSLAAAGAEEFRSLSLCHKLIESLGFECERRRVLRSVGMFAALIDFKLRQKPPTQPILRNHALDRVRD